MNLPVLHIFRTAVDRGKTKYTNPIRYYFSKYFVKNKDKF